MNNIMIDHLLLVVLLLTKINHQMNILNKSVTTSEPLSPSDSWTTIDELVIDLPNQELPTTVLGQLTIANFSFGSDVSNTYTFRLLLGTDVIAEVRFSDDAFPTGQNGIRNLPISFHGVGTYDRRTTQLKAEWMMQGTGNGQIPTPSMCTISAILDTSD